jgi:alpha-ketoglutarate-dependent taurine dioxygenase
LWVSIGLRATVRVNYRHDYRLTNFLVILNYLYDVYENNVDIQVRFKWTPGTSALWDNRITIHNASWDYEGNEPRHGTRVTALAEKPFFKADAPTRRQALGLAGPGDI